MASSKKRSSRSSRRSSRRSGDTRKSGVKDPVHLLTDWRYVACRKAEQRGLIHGSRNPGEVTCTKCMKAQPSSFDLVDRAYAHVLDAGVHWLKGSSQKKRDDVVEWVHAVGGPEVVLRMSPLKIREGIGAYLG